MNKQPFLRLWRGLLRPIIGKIVIHESMHSSIHPSRRTVVNGHAAISIGVPRGESRPHDDLLADVHDNVRLRAASSACKKLFPRHCPLTTIHGGFVYFVALEKPNLIWRHPKRHPNRHWDPREESDLPCTLAEETGHNRFCPLKVYRLDAHDAGRLQNFEPQRRMARRLNSVSRLCRMIP